MCIIVSERLRDNEVGTVGVTSLYATRINLQSILFLDPLALNIRVIFAKH